MRDFLILVKIENKKLFHHASTLVMALILAALVVGLTGLLKYAETAYPDLTGASQPADDSSGWQTQLQTQVDSERQQLTQVEQSSDKTLKASAGALRMSVAEHEYALRNNIDPNGLKSVWSQMNELGTHVNPSFAAFIALFAIIAGSAAVAGEFTENTMKMMIARPFSRSLILSAKLASVALYGLLLFAETFVIAFGASGLLFGFHGLGANDLLWTGHRVLYLPAVLKTLAVYGLDFLQVLVYIILAFALSVLSRSRVMATGIALFLLLVGGGVSQLLALYFGWGRYILFGVSDFSSYLLKGTAIPGTSLGFGLVVAAVYTAVFLFGSYFPFLRRDV